MISAVDAASVRSFRSGSVEKRRTHGRKGLGKEHVAQWVPGTGSAYSKPPVWRSSSNAFHVSSTNFSSFGGALPTLKRADARSPLWASYCFARVKRNATHGLVSLRAQSALSRSLHRSISTGSSRPVASVPLSLYRGPDAYALTRAKLCRNNAAKRRDRCLSCSGDR